MWIWFGRVSQYSTFGESVTTVLSGRIFRVPGSQVAVAPDTLALRDRTIASLPLSGTWPKESLATPVC